MDRILNDLFLKITEGMHSEKALSDLRYVIERFTMDRYDDEEALDYLDSFYDKDLIDYRLTKESLQFVKFFLFYVLLNFPDRAVLTAKCIKVLFDESSREAICTSIEIYVKTNDDVTCELIYAITDLGDRENYFSNNRIKELFMFLSENGGENSKTIAQYELKNYKN